MSYHPTCFCVKLLRRMFFFGELGRHERNCLMAGAVIPVRSRAVKWRSPRHGREWLSTFPFLVCWWWILGDGEQGNSVQSKGSLSIDTWHYHNVGSTYLMVVVILCVCARRSEWTLNVVSTSKNTRAPKKWRAQVIILKPLSTTFQNMLTIIIFNWWHQGHPVRASSHWTKGSNLVPSRELTYPQKMAFWRWFSFSQGGIC